MKLSTKDLIFVAMGASIMAVLTQISIPFPVVPLTLQCFGAILLGTIFGAKLSTMSILVYILLGAVGIPVFSGGRSGFGALFGATGGFIFGFILLAFGSGIASNFSNKKIKIGIVYISLISQYLVGIVQLAFITKSSFAEAVIMGIGVGGVYLIKDIVLGAVAIFVGQKVKYQLKRTLAN
ncbi:MAG: hypothetical protein ATN36_08260 [Epulopiscium sp. Nele67-Bin005]|nr:MAG: hypothetical protein ATN36_08260 [Epulopiscium sp. Nele67-Bin005]